jgi:hypothetical protein
MLFTKVIRASQGILFIVAVSIVVTLAADYLFKRYGDRRLCDRQCVRGQCACVLTCPTERGER